MLTSITAANFNLDPWHRRAFVGSPVNMQKLSDVDRTPINEREELPPMPSQPTPPCPRSPRKPHAHARCLQLTWCISAKAGEPVDDHHKPRKLYVLDERCSERANGSGHNNDDTDVFRQTTAG